MPLSNIVSDVLTLLLREFGRAAAGAALIACGFKACQAHNLQNAPFWALCQNTLSGLVFCCML